MKLRKQDKEKFYLFTGIEQTLVSKNWLDTYYSGLPIYGEAAPDPQCIKALNYLIQGLEKKYDVKLVVTSKKREFESNCEHYLKLYGLDYHKPMFFTKFVAGPRGEKVVDFLEDQGASPLTFHTAPLYVRFIKNFKDNPDFKNYVVVDGSAAKLSKYIPSSQIKRVSKKTGLTQSVADEILLQNGIDPLLMNMI